ncbi:MAG: hypothetical protein DRH11_16255, partial [Deltaproteobacteria bacterium]
MLFKKGVLLSLISFALISLPACPACHGQSGRLPNITFLPGWQTGSTGSQTTGDRAKLARRSLAALARQTYGGPGPSASRPSCPRTDISSLCPEGDTLYLVSFSVPDTSLESVFEEAFLTEGRLR